MATTNISFRAEPTDASSPLGLEAWIDDHLIYDTPALASEQLIKWTLDAPEGPHQLRFVLKHKQQSHTEVDDKGEITRDSCIRIHDVRMDDINIDVLMNEKAIYEHDFNGSGNSVQDRFYHTMGCNGTVQLGFSTPIYVWLLENM